MYSKLNVKIKLKEKIAYKFKLLSSFISTFQIPCLYFVVLLSQMYKIHQNLT